MRIAEGEQEVNDGRVEEGCIRIGLLPARLKLPKHPLTSTWKPAFDTCISNHSQQRTVLRHQPNLSAQLLRSSSCAAQ
eukprot:3825376-Rhodomonas_salina.3